MPVSLGSSPIPCARSLGEAFTGHTRTANSPEALLGLCLSDRGRMYIVFFQKLHVVETMRQDSICIGWNPARENTKEP